MKIGSCYLVALRCTTSQGRRAVHDDEQARCLTCLPVPSEVDPATTELAPWSDTCKAVRHKRQQIRHSKITSLAPAETERVCQLKGEVDRALTGIGISLGRGLRSVPKSRKADLDKAVAAVVAKVQEANAELLVCSIDVRPILVEVDPAAAETETLKTIEKEIEDAVQGMIEALASGNAKALAEKAAESRDLAQMIDSRAASEEVAHLQAFAKRAARDLKVAATVGEQAIERARAEASLGATRFAAIFARLATAQTPAPTADALGAFEEVRLSPAAARAEATADPVTL